MGRTLVGNDIDGLYPDDTQTLVTIGDGVASFGVYNVTSFIDVTDCFQSTINTLTTGGRIVVLPGSYNAGVSAIPITIDKPDIEMVGTGGSLINLSTAVPILVLSEDFRALGLSIINAVNQESFTLGDGSNQALRTTIRNCRLSQPLILPNNNGYIIRRTNEAETLLLGNVSKGIEAP